MPWISWLPPKRSFALAVRDFEMSIEISRGKTDSILEEIRTALISFETDRPDARIDLYRHSSASVRVRIIDPGFDGMSKKQRNDLVWKYLEPVSEDAQGDISMLVLLTPDEVEKSMGNLEFEDPVPTRL